MSDEQLDKNYVGQTKDISVGRTWTFCFQANFTNFPSKQNK